ncbi:MAG: hypothetical protein A4E28_00001 [Methanocella sp. PtaU1.Bin125]|nr:MAG: hypothetical protein A4E28_00001 [Methanocella sp. PtaU1.Bin125]
MYRAAAWRLRSYVFCENGETPNLFKIELRYPDGYTNQHITNNTGFDEFPLGTTPQYGNYTITVSKSGYVTKSESFTLPDDFTYYPIDMQYRSMWSFFMEESTVIEPDGPPGSGTSNDYQLYAFNGMTSEMMPATFAVYDNYTHSSMTYVSSLASNPPYIAWASLVDNRTYMITASAPGYADEVKIVNVYGGAQGFPFYMYPAGNMTVRGTVKDEEGVAIKSWIHITDSSGLKTYTIEETADDGSFDIPLNPAYLSGRLVVTISDIDNLYTVAAFYPVVPDSFPNGVYTINAILYKSPNYYVNVTVNAALAEGFYVYLLWPYGVHSQSNLYMGSTLSLPVGRAAPLGEYNVTVSKLGFVSQTKTADCPDDFVFDGVNRYTAALVFDMGAGGPTPTSAPGSPTPGYQRMNDTTRAEKLSAAIGMDFELLPAFIGALILALLLGVFALIGGRIR